MSRSSVDLEAEVTYRLKKAANDHGNDPEKIWVVLQYPDSLKVTASKLDKLLEALRTCEILGMNQFEWTLSGRVNCKEDQEETRAEETDEASTIPMIKLEPAITSYYSVTAPVKGVTNIDPKHGVKKNTKTVIVDMRYRFLAKQLRVRVKDSKSNNYIYLDTATVLDCIADEVRDIVTMNLISSSDNDEYKVYVLKPQNQTLSGVSPRPNSVELMESLGFPPTLIDQDSVNPPPEKKPKLNS